MSKSFKDNLDQKTAVETAPEISNDGVEVIHNIIMEHTDYHFYYGDMEQLLEGREFVNRRGKLSKRIKRNLKKMYNLSLPNEALTAIGNQAHRYTLRDGTYQVEVSQDLAGTVGLFGDSDSCFRDGHENGHHLVAMDEHPDFYAVRIFRESGSRLARSWGYDSGDGFILFNAYGITLNKVASLLSLALDQPMREVMFSFDGWLNDRSCFAIGGDARNTSYSAYCDPESQREDDIGACEHCDNRLHDGEDYHMADWGDMYCEGCWSDLFHRCDHCHQWMESDINPFQSVRGRHGTQHVCMTCRDNYYTLCDHCDRRIHPIHMADGCDLGNLCQRCFDTKVAICPDCNGQVFQNDTQTWQEEHGDHNEFSGLCHSCYQDRNDAQQGLSSTPDQSPVCTGCGSWSPLSIKEDGRCSVCHGENDQQAENAPETRASDPETVSPWLQSARQGYAPAGLYVQSADSASDSADAMVAWLTRNIGQADTAGDIQNLGSSAANAADAIQNLNDSMIDIDAEGAR